MLPGNRSVFLITTTLAVVCLAGCDGSQRSEVKPAAVTAPGDTVLVYARGADSVGLDPAAVTDGESVKVCSNLYEGLLEYTAGGTDVQPCLAESWTVSEDGLKYTFKLRSGVKFHDGTSFDAEAVLATFQRQMDPEHRFAFGLGYSNWEGMFASVIAGVAAKDAETVEFTLTAPCAPFLANMAMYPVYVVSPAALAKHGQDITLHPVGTGPYRFVRWLKDAEIVLERNPGYWREPARNGGIRFLPIAENSSRFLRMKQGEFHFMDGLSTEHFDLAEQAPNLKLLRQPGMNVAYLSLNHRGKPFEDVRVRRAVCHALRKDVIVKIVYDGHAVAAKNPIPPTMWGYDDGIVDYPYDVKQAQALLAEAGATGVKVELHIMQNPRPYVPNPGKLAQVIKDDLGAAGFDVTIHPSTWEAHLKATRNGEHDMALMGWIGDNGDPDNFLYMLLDKDTATLGSAANISFYMSDELHEVLIAAQQAGDQGERVRLYKQAQEIIHRDVGFVPLVHTEDTIVLDKRIEGFVQNPTGTLRLRETSLSR